MELAKVHKYSTFIEFPQDGAYRLVEMQHCRNSVELLHEMLNLTVKELVRKKKSRSFNKKYLVPVGKISYIYIYR